MYIITKDRGKLEAAQIVILPYNNSHDFLVTWIDGNIEHMRKGEIISIDNE